MEYAISADDLHVSYRNNKGQRVPAVGGLSFTVQPGEVVGFLGPNGAGKSSTLKALMGFVEPAAGTATIFGNRAGSQAARKRAGYLPEVALYYPFLTPMETLLLYGQLQGLRGKALRQEAVNLLEMAGIADSAKKLNRSLSKGMLQRVGIAQALLGSPELLILDEVTSGLDPIGRKELRDLLKGRQRSGCTLFFSSHELSEVEMLCDRILVIDKGKLVEEKQIESLKADLAVYRLAYIGKMVIPGALSTSLLDSEATQAVFSCKAHLIQGIEKVHAGGGTVVDVVAQEGSLEDYFIEVLGRAA